MAEQKLLNNGLTRLGINLNPDSLNNILAYCRELEKWNKRINLIARNTSPAEIIEKHFLDSLTLLTVLDQAKADATLLDVGTGAGFPGLVLAAVRPALQVTLVEPRQKRVSFLRHIIRLLQVNNVCLIAERLEQAVELRTATNHFSFITSRAVAAADQFLPMVEPLAAADSRVIMMQATENLRDWLATDAGMDWQLVDTVSFTLPFSGHPRLLSVLSRQRP
jgi:16S rRNA (guanine527-N7)-methyltransferase